MTRRLCSLVKSLSLAVAFLVSAALALEDDLTKHFGLLEQYSACEGTLARDFSSNFLSHGDAKLVSNNRVELTSDRPKTFGAMWTKQPLAENVTQWILQFSFSVQSKSYLGEKGLALWYVTEPAPTANSAPSSNAFMGLGSSFDGLAIFFDSVNDKIHRYDPKISGMYLRKDSTNPLDVTDFEQFQQEKSFGNCFVNYRSEDMFPVEGRVIYARRTLRVEFRLPTEGATFIPCFLQEDFDLPTKGYFGVTAATGEFSADVHSVHKFQVLDASLPGSQTQESSVEAQTNKEKSNSPSPVQSGSGSPKETFHSGAGAKPTTASSESTNLERAVELDATTKQALADLKETQKHVIHSLRSLQQQMLSGFNDTFVKERTTDYSTANLVVENHKMLKSIQSMSTHLIEHISGFSPKINVIYEDIISVHKSLAEVTSRLNQNIHAQSANVRVTESSSTAWSWSFLFAVVILQSIVLAAYSWIKSKVGANHKANKIF